MVVGCLFKEFLCSAHELSASFLVCVSSMCLSWASRALRLSCIFCVPIESLLKMALTLSPQDIHLTSLA